MGSLGVDSDRGKVRMEVGRSEENQTKLVSGRRCREEEKEGGLRWGSWFILPLCVQFEVLCTTSYAFFLLLFGCVH